MPDIKKSDPFVKTIKTADKSLAITNRMKADFIKTREKIKRNTTSDEDYQEYAANRFSENVDTFSRDSFHMLKHQGEKSIDATRYNVNSLQKAKQEYKIKHQYDIFEKERSNRYAQNNIYREAETKANETAAALNEKIKLSSGKINTTGATVNKSSANLKNRPLLFTNYQFRKNPLYADKAYKAAKESNNLRKGLKNSMRSFYLAIRSIVNATKATLAALIAAGWIAVVVIVVVCLIALLANSSFGIFFSGEPTKDSPMVMKDTVQEISIEFDDELDKIISLIPHDILEIKGSIAPWKNVVALYAVKTNTSDGTPQEVATMTPEKARLLSKVFWDVNFIDTSTEEVKETKTVESTDEFGNVTEKEVWSAII